MDPKTSVPSLCSTSPSHTHANNHKDTPFITPAPYSFPWTSHSTRSYIIFTSITKIYLLHFPPIPKYKRSMVKLPGMLSLTGIILRQKWVFYWYASQKYPNVLLQYGRKYIIIYDFTTLALPICVSEDLGSKIWPLWKRPLI